MIRNASHFHVALLRKIWSFRRELLQYIFRFAKFNRQGTTALYTMGILFILVATVGLILSRGDPLLFEKLTPNVIQKNETLLPVVVTSCAAPKRTTVYQALNELFTCLLETHIERSDTHSLAGQLKFGRLAGSGARQSPLLMGLFSTGSLISRHESHRLYYDLARWFPTELGQNETSVQTMTEEKAAKIQAYLIHLESSPYVVDTYRTLVSNDALSNSSMSLRDFVQVVMFDHWFKPYGRQAKSHNRGVKDSSGFGHVFVGEISSRGVTGFHNWLSILAAEESGTFEYKGFVKVVTEPLVMASIQFSWLGKQKPLSSFAFGVDTEFQIAMFSACFVVKPGRKARLQIKGQAVAVQTYVVSHQPESIGSSYFVL